MSPDSPQPTPPVAPVTSLDDPRVVQILSTEHWSLLSSRSLAYNEAFTRGGMFLTFLSMSFVALALLAQAMSFGDMFLTVAAIALTFDFVVGLTTYGRIIGANRDQVSGWIGSYSDVVLVAVVAAVILYPLTRHLLSRKRKDQRIRG